MLDPELIPLVAARFKALGEPGRLALLAALHEGEKSVGELAQATRRGQPNVSQHLAQLSGAGLVAARREGNRIYYRIADPFVERICDAVCQSVVTRAREDERRARSLKRAGGARKAAQDG